jgi:hypothetical protein
MSKIARFYDFIDVSVPQGLRIPEEPKAKVKFIDNFVGQNKRLIATIRATHSARLTRNNGFYLPDKMRVGAKTMLSREKGGNQGYDKPVLVNHDRGGDAIGRIVTADYVDLTQQAPVNDAWKGLLFDLSKASQMWRAVDIVESLVKAGVLFQDEWQGLGYIKAGALITDPDAIVKILDERYKTVSTGAGSDKAICSICQEDWVAEGAPCEHRPGRMYDDKKCFLIAGNLTYDELSFVNTPADTEAVTEGMQLVDIPVGNGNFKPVVVATSELSDSYVSDIYIFDDSEDSTVTRDELLQKLTDTFKHLEDNKLEELKSIEDDAEFQKAVEDMLEAKELIDKIVAGEATLEDQGIDGSGGNLEIQMLIRLHDSMHHSWDYDVKYEKDRIPKSVFALHTKLMDLAESKGFRDDIMNGALDMVNSDGEDMEDSADEDAEGSANIEDDAGDTEQTLTFDNIDLDKKEFTDEEVECINDAIEAELLDMIEEGIECTSGGCLVSLEDAKLSTSKRKGLPSSSFCGPNRSFPVPDCAHVTAARRLIGRYKGPGKKSSILACVSRKAKAMGCDSKKKDSAEEQNTEDNSKLALATAAVFELTAEDQKCLYEVFTSKLAEAGVLETNLQERVDQLEKDLGEANTVKEAVDTKLEDMVEQLKWLRVELTDVHNDYRQVNDELEAEKTEAHRLLVQNTALLNLHRQGEDAKYEDILKAQEEKQLIELKDELNDLQDSVDFDKMVTRLGQESNETTEQVEDPTLSDADQHTEETSDTMTTDKWTDQVISKYKEMREKNGESAAKRYLLSAKYHQLVPKDFDISKHLENSE